jgi:probable HAF family extracellular repeat protein
MGTKSSMRIIAAALSAAFAVSAQTATQEQEHKKVHFTRYTVTDLGTLGGTAGAAFGINNRGHVSGQGALAGNANEHAFLYVHGQKSDLGTLGAPGLNSTVGTINDRDEVAIISETSATDPFQENFCAFFTSHSCVGAVWKRGSLTPLPTLGGTNAFADGVNNRGEVVGYAENSTQDPTCPTPQKLDFEAVTWEPNGEIHELPPLKGDTVGFALGMNNRGDVAGGSGTCANTPLFPLVGGPHAILWENRVPRDLGSLGGTLISTAAAVNDRREVAGGSYLSGDQTVHSFFWTEHGGMEDMGTVSPDLASFATAINERGQVVGASCDVNPLTAQAPPNCRAYLWQDGQMVDLNTLIPADSPLYLLFAYQINGAGDIVGQACVTANGECTAELHAFVATACGKGHDNGVEYEAAEPDVTAERPRPFVPDNARKLIQRQIGRRDRIGSPQ